MFLKLCDLKQDTLEVKLVGHYYDLMTSFFFFFFILMGLSYDRLSKEFTLVNAENVGIEMLIFKLGR